MLGANHSSCCIYEQPNKSAETAERVLANERDVTLVKVTESHDDDDDEEEDDDDDFTHIMAVSESKPSQYSRAPVK